MKMRARTFTRSKRITVPSTSCVSISEKKNAVVKLKASVLGQRGELGETIVDVQFGNEVVDWDVCSIGIAARCLG